MGVKQSKRSVDITETSTKGEIEGFGNEGKVEKLIDGVIEKVAANGHVDGDLQNGVEAHQNGIEPIQNGEAAAVATEKVTDKKEIDEPVAEGTVNGMVENGEINGEAEKTEEEEKKPEEKKEKKKKDKVVKKKFSFRNFSFSKKDKSKPSKEEKSPGKMDAPGIEEVPVSAEKNEEETSPALDQTAEVPKLEESDSQATVNITMITTTTFEQPISEIKQSVALEDISETEAASKPSPEDLPPPLPASPPPSEPVDGKISSEAAEKKPESGVVEAIAKDAKEVTSSISNALTDKMETSTNAMKDPEQIAIETGKQIEEKATNLLKTVEERAEESMRTAGEAVAQKTEDVMEAVENALGGLKQNADSPDAKKELSGADTKEDTVTTIPVEIANLDSLASKAEDASEKHEESGAGESLADIPKDLAEEVTAASIEATNPDSLEMAATLPPPPVEPPTGE